MPGSRGSEMTVAPCATAYLMPAAMAAGSRPVTAASASSGSLYSRVTCTDRIRAPGAIPVMPSDPPDPCPCPAMRPATAVPSSAQYAWPGPRPVLAKSGPVVTVPVRSGWLPSTPVERTATVTPWPARGRGAPGGGHVERRQPPFGRAGRAGGRGQFPGARGQRRAGRGGSGDGEGRCGREPGAQRTGDVGHAIPPGRARRIGAKGAVWENRPLWCHAFGCNGTQGRLTIG